MDLDDDVAPGLARSFLVALRCRCVVLHPYGVFASTWHDKRNVFIPPRSHRNLRELSLPRHGLDSDGEN